MKLTNQIFSNKYYTHTRAGALTQLFNWCTGLFEILLFCWNRSLRWIHRQEEKKSTHMRMPSTSNEIITLEKFLISQFQTPMAMTWRSIQILRTIFQQQHKKKPQLTFFFDKFNEILAVRPSNTAHCSIFVHFGVKFQSSNFARAKKMTRDREKWALLAEKVVPRAIWNSCQVTDIQTRQRKNQANDAHMYNNLKREKQVMKWS